MIKLDNFVAYSLPGSVDFCVRNIKASSNQTEDFEDCNFVVAPFDTALVKSFFLQLDEDELQGEFTFNCEDIGKTPSTGFEDYQEAFRKSKRLIRSGNLEKIVLSKIKSIQVGQTKPMEIFNLLVKTYPSAFVYLLHADGIGCWMGASPELLIERTENQYRTVAIAGTQKTPINLNTIEWTEEEQKEQHFIEQFLLSVFESNGINYKKTEKYNYRAGEVCHIRSDFSFEAKMKLYDLLSMLHPGPAISGHDASKAKKHIAEIERHKRNYYAGYLGPIFDKEKLSVFVNLRCMRVYKQQYCLYLGGGLVEGSRVEKEWKETELKARTLQSIIELVNNDIR